MKTGYLWAIASALLVTAAQLLLKIGMSELPDLQLENSGLIFIGYGQT